MCRSGEYVTDIIPNPMEFLSDDSSDESVVALEVHSDDEDSDYSESGEQDVTVADEDVVNNIYRRRLMDQRGAEYISFAALTEVLNGGCSCSESSSSLSASEATPSCFVRTGWSMEGLLSFRKRWGAYRKSTGELKRELGKVLQEHRQDQICEVPGKTKSKQLYFLNSREVCIDAFARALDEPVSWVRKVATFGHQMRRELPRHHADESPLKTLLVRWLLHYAGLTSEPNPGGGAHGAEAAVRGARSRGESGDDVSALRLAECRLSDVHSKYEAAFRLKGIQALGYETMRRCMKEDPRLRHVHLSRRRGNVGGLGICATCENLKENLFLIFGDRAEREIKELEYVAHLDFVLNERVAVQRTFILCEVLLELLGPNGEPIPKRIHIKFYANFLVDAMSKHATTLPHFHPHPKNIDSSQLLNVTLMGVTAICGPRFVFQIPQNQSGGGCHAANETLECLEEAMRQMVNLGYVFDADVLVANLDNHAGSNKTPVILLWGADLVLRRVFRKVKFRYLIRGHTHNLQDQIFSVLGRSFRKWSSFVFDMKRQAAAIRDAFRDEENKPVPFEIRAIRDFSRHYKEQLAAVRLEKLASPEGDGVQHSYTIKHGPSGEVVLEYKKYNQSSERYPRPLQVGERFQHPELGIEGEVVSAAWLKKSKAWSTLVRYPDVDGDGESVECYELPVRGIEMFPGPPPPTGAAPFCPMCPKWPEAVASAVAIASKASGSLAAFSLVGGVVEWWSSFAEEHTKRIAAAAAGAPYYADATPTPHLMGLITPRAPAAAAAMAPPQLTAASYTIEDPILHAAYQKADRERIQKGARACSSHMMPGQLVLLRLRRHDKAPATHRASACVARLPAGYDHAAALASPADDIVFDAFFTSANCPSTGKWEVSSAVPHVHAPLRSVLVSGIALTATGRRLTEPSKRRISDFAGPQGELGPGW